MSGFYGCPGASSQDAVGDSPARACVFVLTGVMVDDNRPTLPTHILMSQSKGATMDDIDRKLLTLLMEEGRSTWVDLAQAVGLSAPSVTERVRKLEQAGIIRGYVAVVNAAAVQQRLLALVSVSLASTSEHDEFVEAVLDLPQVQECHIVAGDFDYVLKVRCRDGEALAILLREEIRSLPGVAATSTRIILQTMKETTIVPLPDPT